MIPIDFIRQWRLSTPWQSLDQVEQDLILSRAIAEIFSHPKCFSNLAFRGGTCLNKLVFAKPVRFSEDIDLVLTQSIPYGEIIDALRKKLDPWLGKPRRKTNPQRVNLYYRYQSESSENPTKIKVEINTSESKSFGPLVKIPFKVSSNWYSGEVEVPTFSPSELIGTKIRAFYQRRKGRDLFDLWYALETLDLNWEEAFKIFMRYLKAENLKISRENFLQNLEEKSQNQSFVQDIVPLLRTEFEYDQQIAFKKLTDLAEKFL